MAVTSAAAERIDLPRSSMDRSLSKAVSDDVSDSSTSPNDSSPTHTPDRNDASNASPNPSCKDVDIQSQSALRSEEYRQLFRLPPEEFLVQDFNCAFQESILLQKVIAFNEITSVNRAKTAGIFPNAIEIFAGGRRYFFASFLSRDEAFKIINDGWLQHVNGAQEITEQQESMTESSTHENGFVAIENINSSLNPVNDTESADRQEDAPTSSGSKVPSTTDTNAEGLWDVERDNDGPKEGCVLRVYVNVAFSKKTVWKGKIVQSTLEECREAYTTWIDRAHELLKQNIDKQGGVKPSESSTGNGELQVEREVATTEPSERSHTLSDPVRTLQMSDSLDVNQRIGNLLQESLTSALSIASLLSEFARKSFSYLKSQGHIALVLAVAFTVILLMQVSIVVLLNRPQQVHVNYPVEYMGSMMRGGGGGGGESRAEAVAWLEKRMHHLKEETTMVEARLERMWHEHAALKAELKELGKEMAGLNPFDLLGDDDTGELSLLIAAQQKAVAATATAAAPKKGPAKSQAKMQPATQAKLPSKPLPPAQAGELSLLKRDFANDENLFSNNAVPEDGESGKPSERCGYGGPRPYRGGRRGGFSNGEDADGEQPRRLYERRSGTGRGNELKREGSGRGNWGTQTDELAQVTEEVANEGERNLGDEKPAGEEDARDANKESASNEPEEKEPEDKEMTLEEYEKVLEEKRKALQALKIEERKVDAKEFESMQQLSNKKSNDEVFIKLGSDKDKRKEAYDREERAKKSVSINEFLKPAEGERYYNPSGRGRGRGRGSRGFGGGNAARDVAAPSIEDPGHFPILGGK
ncbi:hypothetical protein GOBAR_DD03040 [Gossypium barbadense]|nr:hypothetical protein GOBAR_DD03040 [Gossypium barbadense]